MAYNITIYRPNDSVGHYSACPSCCEYIKLLFTTFSTPRAFAAARLSDTARIE